MTTLEIILLIISLLLLALYVTSKMGKEQSLHEVIKEVKQDLKNTAENVYELVNKAKEVVFDESVQKTIKEFIMIVEEKNKLAKDKGESYLAGDDKKLAVISRLSEWISNVTGSTEKAVEFVETNQSKIETIIDDYISFSNKMQGKETLSEAEKIIADKLSNKG
jgi:F0F1-type ATP synthase membrane subunit b/b'